MTKISEQDSLRLDSINRMHYYGRLLYAINFALITSRSITLWYNAESDDKVKIECFETKSHEKLPFNGAS